MSDTEVDQDYCNDHGSSGTSDTVVFQGGAVGILTFIGYI